LSTLTCFAGSRGFGAWLGQLQSLNGCGRGGEQALLPPCSLAYSLLQSATDNFSSSHLLGVGRLGHIYKAKLDYDIFVTVRRVEEEEKISAVNFQVLTVHSQPCKLYSMFHEAYVINNKTGF
jgi:hypothetical protein